MGLHCYTGFSLVVSRGCSIVAGHRLLIVEASVATAHGLWGKWTSVAMAHGLSSCSSCALEHRLGSCGAQA